MLLLIAPLLLLAGCGSAANALTLTDPEGNPVGGKYQRWADDAGVPVPPGEVALHLGGDQPPECPVGNAVCYESDHIYAWRAFLNRAMLLHELGHRFDDLVLSDPDRDRFRQIVGDTRPWRTPPNAPHEKFAEAYSVCARYPDGLPDRYRPSQVRFGYDYKPTRREHRAVCRLIERSAD